MLKDTLTTELNMTTKLNMVSSSICPFSCPTVDYYSEWHDKELWWIIDSKLVSDIELRAWCYRYLNYPWCHVDVIQIYHINAWAYYSQ